MALKINQKFLLVMVLFFLVPSAMFITTLFTISKQKNDGLVINLAGRQRMLSQKMSKECLTYIHLLMLKDKAAPAMKASLLTTMAVFETTLDGLMKSGNVPLTFDLNGKKRFVPAAVRDAAVQLNKVKTLWVPFKDALNQTIETKEEEHIQKVLADNLLVLSNMDKAVQIMQKQAESKISFLYYALIACVVVGIVIVVFVLLWSNRKIVKPIIASVDFAQVMAGGDLSQKIDVQQQDEIGTLSDALNHMVETLSGMIKNINQDVVTLNESSSEMNAISDQMTSFSDSTVAKSNTVAAAAEETDSNMNSLAAAMEETSVNMESVASATEEMSTSISDITQRIGEARGNTENAVERSQQASKQINELGRAAQEIGEVSNTITDISDKTDLLALNATIEAARAGDAGKGFAVVASEIKELAQQTAEATGDIAKKLQGVQDLTDKTVTMIEEITEVVNQVNLVVFGIDESVEQQSMATKEISQNINQVSQGIKEINENISQTNQATGQVAQEITEVNESANHLSNSSAQIQQTSVQLKELSEHLKGLVDQFTIET
ncbi:MAG: methyl-accepting chemotaxis protein [Proteobacteria bacterium]|nr:methyl-accepting chemotaxis protein [Pseudomonadota bacterium]